MKIVVCLKQVPDTKDIKWTEKGTMIREGVESILNPFDEIALEYALKIKDKIPDTKITVISMGPAQVKELLRVAIARGADDAVLISDKKFSGADTLATAYTISTAIKKYIPDFDLIITGQFAIDGDTGQTPPNVAVDLGIENITFVKNIVNINNDNITVLRETECGFLRLKANFPILISLMKSDIDLRHFSIKNYIKSFDTKIKLFDKTTLNIEDEKIGFKGSPTYVSATYTPTFSRSKKQIKADELLDLIKEE